MSNHKNSLALRPRRWIGPAASMLVMVGSGLLAEPGFAQDALLPPKHTAVDDNGVDLISGLVTFSQPVNSIGGEGASGLAVSHILRAGSPISSLWSFVDLKYSSDDISSTVSFLGKTESFSGIPNEGVIPQGGALGTISIDGQELVYRLPSGIVGRFRYRPPTTTNVSSKTRGELKSVRFPSGEVWTFTYNQIGAPLIWMQVESSLGYALAGSNYADTYDAIASNLTQGGCANAVCSGPTFANQAALGRSLQTSYSFDTKVLTVTGPTGEVRRYTFGGPKGRVIQYTDGRGTWAYAYTEVIDDYATTPPDGILTTTVTDPLGRTRVMTARMNDQLLLSDTNGLGQTTTFGYTNGLISQVTSPQGDRTRYEYSGNNIVAIWRDPKPGSSEASTSTTASYNTALCASIKVCDKPDWVRDARGNQTDFTYDPVHGGVLTVTKPAGTNGVRPQTRYTYGQFTARYISGGAWVNGPPVWRLIRTSTCASGAPPACLGTADETVTEYAYEPSNVANNVRLLSTRTRAGDNSLLATTSYAYDARGDVISTDGPLPGTADTTRSFYDASRWKVGEIGPDPDGAGPLAYRARKTTYANDGQVTLVETGKTTSQADMSSFSALQQVFTDYDAQRRAAKTSLVVGGATQMVTQYGYDAAGRQICSTVRMNPAAFGALPSACVLGSAGPAGDDRITYTEYDAAGRVTKITSGYGGTP